MAETFAVSEAVRRKLKELGYTPDTSMAGDVERWWSWYTATAEWYTVQREVLGHRFRAKRRSVHPARFVCREWASAILDDDGTTVTVEDLGRPMGDDPGEAEVLAVEDASEWLADWCDRNRFVNKAQMALERAFALGTAAMALWFHAAEDGTVRVRPRRYDARMVLPLTWDDDEVTECAFVTTARYKGRAVDQLQCHVLEDDGYHVKTWLFSRDQAGGGTEIRDDSILEDYATGTRRPAFCILRPALDNVYSDGTALGQSVFADAIDVLKGVDNAWDSLQDEIDTTKVKVFMSDDLIDVVDKDGRPQPIPMSPDNIVIHKVAGNGVDQMLQTFQPKIRTTELVAALNIALAELGAICGFGPNYLRFDKDGGLKTAKEVSSDNSTFARNIRKHENEIEPQLEALLGCLVDCVTGSDGAQVNVRFDDSIISDTDSEKTMMMAEIGAGVMLPREYRQKFLGEGEDEAQAAIDQIMGVPTEDAMPGTLE